MYLCYIVDKTPFDLVTWWARLRREGVEVSVGRYLC